MLNFMVERVVQNDILENLIQFPVVGIIGPRQVGKTTLAKSIDKQINISCRYLDLELPTDITKLEDPEFYFEQHKDECIVLDEIQNMPELFPIIRGVVDKNRHPGKFILLGSASPKLIRKSSDSLAGRIGYTALHPFNLTEILSDKADLYKHWFNGGFPGSYLTNNEKKSKKWLYNFVQTYTDKDLQLLGMPASPAEIRKLLSMIASYQGGIWNASNFAKSMGNTYATVNKYIDFLEDAFLIHKLPAFNFNIKKRLVKSPKIYIRDSGILHYLLNIPDFEQLQGNLIIGNSWEGYVIEQIYQLLPPDTEMYYYRTHQGAEADLVLVKGMKPVASIEIKLTTAPKISKGFYIATEDLGTNENYVIIPEGEDYRKNDKIRVCNLPDFLNKYIQTI